MGKVRRKHNWKGRQQSDPQDPSDKEKTDVVVEIRGKNERLLFFFKHNSYLWLFGTGV